MGTLFSFSSTEDQRYPEPLTNFLKLKWEFETNSKSTLPALNGQYLITADNLIIDSKTGKKITWTEINSWSDTLLIHSTEYKLMVIDIKNDSLIFERRRNRAHYIGPKQVELVNNKICVEVIDNKLIQAIDVLTKKILWTYHSNSRIFNKPLIFDNCVYISNLNQLLILDRHNGNLINQLSFLGPVLSGIVKSNNFLYMIVENEGLTAVNHNTKSVEWQVPLSNYSSRANRIVIDKDRIFFSGNSLHAVRINDGSSVWEIGDNKDIYIRDSRISIIKNYIIFYSFKYNENILTVADKNTGEILYEGSNSNILGGDSDNSDGVAKEDLLLIDFVDGLIDENILIGVLDNKIYGLEVMK